jgi:hypothetical protein
MPEGLTMLGRWHAPGSVTGWLLVEAADVLSVSHHVTEWSDLVQMEVTPVLDDAEQGQTLAALQGS